MIDKFNHFIVRLVVLIRVKNVAGSYFEKGMVYRGKSKKISLEQN